MEGEPGLQLHDILMLNTSQLALKLFVSMRLHVSPCDKYLGNPGIVEVGILAIE